RSEPLDSDLRNACDWFQEGYQFVLGWLAPRVVIGTLFVVDQQFSLCRTGLTEQGLKTLIQDPEILMSTDGERSGTQRKWGKKTVEKAEGNGSNPCSEEAAQSMKCLHDNAFDRDKCETFFDNYNECKKFWTAVKQHRVQNGISPPLPPLAERAAIKQRFRETGRID
ncbi:unnamed protein product, partial [Notodromas monacha]